MFRPIFRRALIVQRRAFSSRIPTIVSQATVLRPFPVLSRRLYATVQDVATPREEEPSAVGQAYEPSEEYFSNLHEYVTSDGLHEIPADDHEKLKKVSEIMNRMNMFFMLHMRRKDQPLQEHDDGNASAGMQYLEHFSIDSAQPFTHMARLREMVLSLHLASIEILQAIPHTSPALQVSVGAPPGELPTFRNAIYDMVQLTNPIENLQVAWDMAELRERILHVSELPEDVEPVEIVPDSEKASLEARRDAEDPEVQHMLTESEKNTVLEETRDLEDPEEFATAWAPVWNDIVYADTILNAYLSVALNPDQPTEEIRQSLIAVVAARQQEMKQLEESVAADQIAENDESECAEGVLEAATTGEEKTDAEEVIDLLEKAENEAQAEGESNIRELKEVEKK